LVSSDVKKKFASIPKSMDVACWVFQGSQYALMNSPVKSAWNFSSTAFLSAATRVNCVISCRLWLSSWACFFDDDDLGFQEGFRFAFELLGKGQDLWLARAKVQRLGMFLFVSLWVKQFLGLVLVDFDFFTAQGAFD
jgi:hypothetical protein